jgi:hypothetical protein
VFLKLFGMNEAALMRGPPDGGKGQPARARAVRPAPGANAKHGMHERPHKSRVDQAGDASGLPFSTT